METLGVTSNGLCHSSDGWLHTFYIGYHHCQIIPFIPDMTGHHTVKLQQYIVSDFLLLYTHCVNTVYLHCETYYRLIELFQLEIFLPVA